MRTTTRFFVLLGSVSVAASAALLPAGPAGAAVTDASISNFEFSPDPVRIPVGTTLKWTNKDTAPHTVTADDGSWSSPSLSAQGTFSHTFDQPDTIAYHCAIHPNMVGTVVVEGSATTAAPTTTTTAAPPTTTTTAAPTTTTTEIAGDNTTAPTTAGFVSPRATAPKPAAPSTTRATAAPTTATTAPVVTTTEPPATATAPPPPAEVPSPEDTTATTEAALDRADEGNGNSRGAGALVAASTAVLLLGGGTAWWALRRRSTPSPV